MWGKIGSALYKIAKPFIKPVAILVYHEVKEEIIKWLDGQAAKKLAEKNVNQLIEAKTEEDVKKAASHALDRL